MVGRRESDGEDDATDRRFQPKRMYRGVGEPLSDPDFRPRIICRNPEQILAEAFLKAGRDYAGPLPADFMLHAVLQERVDLAVAAASQPLADLGRVLIKREMSASEAEADMRWSPRNFAFW